MRINMFSLEQTQERAIVHSGARSDLRNPLDVLVERELSDLVKDQIASASDQRTRELLKQYIADGDQARVSELAKKWKCTRQNVHFHRKKYLQQLQAKVIRAGFTGHVP